MLNSFKKTGGSAVRACVACYCPTLLLTGCSVTSGARSGWERDNVSGTAQRLIEDLLEKFETKTNRSVGGRRR